MAEDGKLEWVFSLLDKVSGPSAKMAGGLKKLQRGMDEMDRAAGKAHKHTESLGLKLLEFTEVAKTAYEALHKIGESIFDFGKEAMSAVSFKENAMIALKAVTGTVQGAHEVFEAAESFANGFRLPVQPIVKMAEELASVGLDVSHIMTALKGGGDVFAISGGDISQMQAYVQMIKNFTSAEDVLVNQVGRQAISVGLKQADVYRELAKIMGLTGEAAAQLVAELKAGTSTHKIPGADAITAMQRALRAQEHGALGSSLAAGRGTFDRQTGQLANNKEQSMAALLSGQGGQVLHGILENLIKLTAPGGGMYKLIADLVNGPLAGFLKQFTGPEGLQKIQEGFKGVLDTVVALVGALKALAEVSLGIAHAVAPVFSGKAGDFLEKAFHEDPDADAKFKAYMKKEMENPTPVPLPTSKLPPPEPNNGRPIPAGARSMNLEFHINAPGATPETADAIRRTLKDEVLPALAVALEQAKLEAGA